MTPDQIMSLPARDAERLAYAEGFENAAKLLGRIADLQHHLSAANAEIDRLQVQLDQERAGR